MTEVPVAPRLHYEMKVVRHQAVRQNSHRDSLARTLEQVDEVLVVTVVVKNPCVRISAIDRVITNISDQDARRPRHDASLARSCSRNALPRPAVRNDSLRKMGN